MNKIKVAVLYGGESPEHEVSKMTAASILKNINDHKYEVSKIYIAKDGSFDKTLLDKIDVVFLAVHGPNCEDGVLQSYLESRKIAYTGAGVDASRLNMDKIAQHEAFTRAGLRVTKFVVFKKGEDREELKRKINRELHYPLFAKPNNAGSSIGSAKINKENELNIALGEALKCDDQVIIEEAVNDLREIELAVLGNDNLITSQPGEILAQSEFYSYDAKYFHPFPTAAVAKNLTKGQIATFREWAEKAYRATGCAGYARIDFFLQPDGTIFINEINTLPGFTAISLFSKMMEASGISYTELIDRLITLAIERHQKEAKLQTSFDIK